MKLEGGYLLLARKIIDSELMNKPPHYMKLWVWMLGKAFWKNGETLKRGQLLTTIAEMQDAGGYYVGARKKPLSKGEVRSCYEAFAKSTMISTAKTTRGMVITICNYEHYQDFKSYEGHSEQHGENTPKSTGTTHDRERKKKERRIKEKDLVPTPAGDGTTCKDASLEKTLWIARELGRLILANNPKNRELQPDKIENTVVRWSVDIDRMIRLDKREAREVANVVRWCQADDFWKINILSGEKLRKQYDKLVMKMKATMDSDPIVVPREVKKTMPGFCRLCGCGKTAVAEGFRCKGCSDITKNRED